MDVEFAPVLLIILFWIFVGIPISIAKKASQQKKGTRPAAVKQQPADEPEARPKAAQPETVQPERLNILAPSIAPTEHDDSVYRGSLNADTGEGIDPCHDEQMAGLELAGEEDFAPRTAQAKSGIPLGWTGSDVVRGIVMSEILNRKKR